MGLLNKIKTLVESSVDGYSFQFETEKMMNVRADDQTFPCVFFEEYSADGKYNGTRGWKKEVLVELSFMKLASFQCNAIDRESIREDIEANAIMPFIEAFNESSEFFPVDEFTCVPEPPRFDANAVSVMLRFWAKYKIC